MQSETSVSNALITAILDGLPLDDAARRALLERGGLTPNAVRDLHGRTSIAACGRFWREVLRATDDDFVGLEVGGAARAARFGLAARAALASGDLRELLERLARFGPLINDLLACTLEVHDGRARLTAGFKLDPDDLERHAVDILFTAVAAWARAQLGARFELHEVRLRHRLSAARARYERTFATKAVFGCARNELVFAAAALELPMSGGDPELGSILDRYASSEFAARPVVGDLPARVSQILLRELRAGRAVDLARTCEELKTPPRQLQRRLRAAETTFSELFDGARRTLAPELLTQRGANVEQVGFRLGYAEPTAFIRAFKKWYRTTPGEFRRRHGERVARSR